MYSAHFFINTDAVTRGAEYISDSVGPGLGAVVYDIVNETIYSVFEEACDVANSEGGFPGEYKRHLLGNLSQLQPDVFTDIRGYTVAFDLEELGSYEELTRAYHQGAILADGTQHWGPYEGQALKQEDTAERHVYWEALRKGERSVARSDGGTGRVHLKGDWDQTIQSYLEIWGEKSPQWLFIQFGQEEWEPYVPQFDVIGTIEREASLAVQQYVRNYLEQIVDIANTFKTAGVEVGTTKTGGSRVISGTVEIGGKVYRPGRFAPRAAGG